MDLEKNNTIYQLTRQRYRKFIKIQKVYCVCIYKTPLCNIL